MRYVTERRGGWDEWSDEYKAIVGVMIDGTEYSRFIDGVFTDTEGNTLEVEFPMRDEIDSTVDVERYEPEYEIFEAHSLDDFADAVDVESMTIDLTELSVKEF